MPGTAACRVTSGLLSTLYVLAGTMKMYPFIGSVHQELRRGFAKFATVFPGNMIGLRVDPVTYMYGVGVMEVGLGLGMMLGPRKVKVISIGSLMVIMVGAAFSEFSIGMYTKSLFPTGLCFALGYVLNSCWIDEQKKKR
ncbi:transmembrane protein 35B-like [Haliotis rufescens]|uniref:transmembrane protein 35B-like n=1 Tax=Haliotis rufescens TaxID=6454 RepID=UPI00201F3815|nr:transmembrane protein 35B-like [Haliotis rufescens]XP_046327597.2 transmembrane protein 35B-like [Haliotis rufescens]